VGTTAAHANTVTVQAAERAGRWLAVSTSGQDEASQEPDVNAWIADHGYQAAETYRMRFSRYKGVKRHDQMLDRVIADMKNGVITVLVVWQSSRIERRGAYSVFDLARRVREAGGRVEYVKDAYLNETSEMSDVLLALAATKDRKDSQDKSERVTASHDVSRANGALTGKYPFGYTSEGPKHHRAMIATPAGQRYVPEAFTRVADGHTLPAVAAWLTGVTGRTWHPRTVAALIRNPAYRGQWRSGRYVHECPPLVDGELWRRANANLDGRPASRRGQRTDLTTGAALLSGFALCGNPECDASGDGPSPMNRSGAYYRCTGRAAGTGQRHGCGLMVPLSAADALMNEIMGGLRNPELRPVWHPATGHQAEIKDITMRLDELPARRLPREQEQAERERLWAEQDALAALPGKAAWTEYVPVTDENGEPVTYGSRWLASDRAERRAWLREKSGFALFLGAPGTAVDDSEDDDPYESLSRADVYENGRAMLVFRWTGDDDEGLGRGLPAGDDDAE
jgi:DNA invertase Pin-like site-specific DNA recombinase